MKRNIFILTLLLIIGIQEISAQNKIWTLEDCIDYAISNNIGLQRQKLLSESADVNLIKSKMDLLPSLNFQTNANVGFGRSINPVTNLITFKQNFSNSYSLNSNINLFNGFTTFNTISANRFMSMSGMESEKVARNTLIIDIMGAYYQVLYSIGLEEASKMQLDLSEKQLFRMEKMVETGREALSKQYEIESQVSADNLAYTVAKNNADKAITSLRQLLQIQSGTDFEILMPDLNNLLITDYHIRPDSVYEIASQTLPRLRVIEYELQGTEKQIAAVKGNLVPSITLGGSIYTGYYRVISDVAIDQISYADQLKNNNSQALFLSLNIPIFNNYVTGRNIKLAKIRKMDTELRLEQEKNVLYTEIENACLDFNRGRDEYAAAVSNFEFNTKSFEGVEKKFEAGLVDVTVFATAKNTLFIAETEALRTKLQLMVMKLTIQFYSTGEYENSLNN